MIGEMFYYRPCSPISLIEEIRHPHIVVQTGGVNPVDGEMPVRIFSHGGPIPRDYRGTLSTSYFERIPDGSR